MGVASYPLREAARAVSASLRASRLREGANRRKSVRAELLLLVELGFGWVQGHLPDIHSKETP